MGELRDTLPQTPIKGPVKYRVEIVEEGRPPEHIPVQSSRQEQMRQDARKALRGSLTGLAIGLVMLGLSLLLMVVL